GSGTAKSARPGQAGRAATPRRGVPGRRVEPGGCDAGRYGQSGWSCSRLYRTVGVSCLTDLAVLAERRRAERERILLSFPYGSTIVRRVRAAGSLGPLPTILWERVRRS